MRLLNFFKIFFRLPAIVLRNITVASHHLYCNNAIQLKRCLYKSVIIFLSIIITQKINAQTADTTYTDTNYVDTVSMQHADESTGYDDQDDGYVDTTVQHIYDTSQYFFNWKKYLDDPYTNEKIAQRHLIDKDVKQLKSDKNFWYISAIEKMETRLKNDPKYRDSLLNLKNRDLNDYDKSSIFNQSWFSALIWIIIIGIFAAAVIYFLVQNKISIFSKESASSNDEETNEEHEDIFHLSYTKLIQKAEKENDYRVAIRLLFLQTLKLLSDTNNIQYQPDYTNLHYLQQLHQSKYYSEFSKLSRSYEYAWYGKFYISAERYAAIKNDFFKLQSRVS